MQTGNLPVLYKINRIQSDGYYTYCDNYFIRYINVESPCCIPETKTVLYVNYN